MRRGIERREEEEEKEGHEMGSRDAGISTESRLLQGVLCNRSVTGAIL
jgi:hypothetical protein